MGYQPLAGVVFHPEESALPLYLSRSKMCHIIFRNIIQNPVELRKSEIKQTLHLGDFLGHTRKAIEWQIWTALLMYLLLRFLHTCSDWGHSFTRLFTCLRALVINDFKLVYYPRFQKTMLFVRRNDPQELKNLANEPECQPVVTDMLKQFIAEISRTERPANGCFRS